MRRLYGSHYVPLGRCCSPRATCETCEKPQLLCLLPRPFLFLVLCVFVTRFSLLVSVRCVHSSISMSLDLFLSISHLSCRCVFTGATGAGNRHVPSSPRASRGKSLKGTAQQVEELSARLAAPGYCIQTLTNATEGASLPGPSFVGSVVSAVRWRSLTKAPNAKPRSGYGSGKQRVHHRVVVSVRQALHHGMEARAAPEPSLRRPQPWSARLLSSRRGKETRAAPEPSLRRPQP